MKSAIFIFEATRTSRSTIYARFVVDQKETETIHVFVLSLSVHSFAPFSRSLSCQCMDNARVCCLVERFIALVSSIFDFFLHLVILLISTYVFQVVLPLKEIELEI